MNLFHMYVGVNEINLYIDIIPAISLNAMFKTISKDKPNLGTQIVNQFGNVEVGGSGSDMGNVKKSNIEAPYSSPHIIEFNTESKTDIGEEEQYDFTSDDIEWVGERL